MRSYWNWWKYVPGRFLLHENDSMAGDKTVINSPSFERKKRILRFHAWDCNRLPQGLLELQVYWSTSSTQNIHIPDCCYIFNCYKWQRNNFSLQYQTTSSRQLMRIKKISMRDYQLSNTTFSDLTSQELCSRQWAKLVNRS